VHTCTLTIHTVALLHMYMLSGRLFPVEFVWFALILALQILLTIHSLWKYDQFDLYHPRDSRRPVNCSCAEFLSINEINAKNAVTVAFCRWGRLISSESHNAVASFWSFITKKLTIVFLQNFITNTNFNISF